MNDLLDGWGCIFDEISRMGVLGGDTFCTEEVRGGVVGRKALVWYGLESGIMVITIRITAL